MVSSAVARLLDGWHAAEATKANRGVVPKAVQVASVELYESMEGQ